MLYDHRTNFGYHIYHHDYMCYSYKEQRIFVWFRYIHLNKSTWLYLLLDIALWVDLKMKKKHYSKWTSDSYLAPNEEYFSHIMARTNYFRLDYNDVGLVLDQHAYIFTVIARWKQEYVVRNVAPLVSIS